VMTKMMIGDACCEIKHYLDRIECSMLCIGWSASEGKVPSWAVHVAYRAFFMHDNSTACLLVLLR
jgi:hypothetical protein